jgi:hypothetical protein
MVVGYRPRTDCWNRGAGTTRAHGVRAGGEKVYAVAEIGRDLEYRGCDGVFV